MKSIIDVTNIVPVMDHRLSPYDDENSENAMTGWIDGSVKPHHAGPYLRDFDEGEALSWWYEDGWHMDSFFAGLSDIQDAPWRGFDLPMLSTPPEADGVEA